MSLYKLKANFTTSVLSYHNTAIPLTLKYDGLSKAAQVNQNANLSINGDLATAAGSGFSTPHRIAMTSAANDSGSSVQFKITGTSDGSTAQTETINAGNNSTVFSTKAFKTVTEIKVLGGNTQGNVSAGIASILEEAAYSAAQAITYTITADDIPVGIDPLVVNLSSPGITAVFDYGVANQATSREFLVDDDKISTVSSGQVTGALSLVGSATASFSSPHNVTITSGGDDRSGYFKVVGTNSNNAAQTEYVQGSNAGTAVSTNTFKTVSSVTFMDGNSGSPSNKQTAGTVKAGVTDEDKAVTVTVFAAQDSTKESNPHNVSISHAIYQNDKAATAYSGEIANISIPVQDRNLPVGSDSTVQTAKNTKYTFKASDFGYSDPDGVALKKIRIETLEAAGDLEINGADLVVSGGSKNNEIALADISKLTFMPATDAGGSGYGNFTFKVNDGLDWSASANTMKVNVGDSVTTTIKYYAQNTTGTAADQPIKGASIKIEKNNEDRTFTVNKNLSSSSNYSIDGSNDPTLTVYKGYEYTFDMVGGGHPFYLKSTSSTSGTNNEYTSGVTRSGSSNSGQNGDKLIIDVPSDAPSSLWYQCSAHSGMLGKINIFDSSFSTSTSGTTSLTGTPDGQYKGTFSISDSVADAAINITDVGIALDIAVGLNTSASNGQKVAMDINGDGLLNISDVGAILDMAVNLKETGSGVLRDTNSSNVFSSKEFSISAGNDFDLTAYLLGDLNGNYGEVIYTAG